MKSKHSMENWSALFPRLQKLTITRVVAVGVLRHKQLRRKHVGVGEGLSSSGCGSRRHWLIQLTIGAILGVWGVSFAGTGENLQLAQLQIRIDLNQLKKKLERKAPATPAAQNPPKPEASSQASAASPEKIGQDITTTSGAVLRIVSCNTSQPGDVPHAQVYGIPPKNLDLKTTTATGVYSDANATGDAFSILSDVLVLVANSCNKLQNENMPVVYLFADRLPPLTQYTIFAATRTVGGWNISNYVHRNEQLRLQQEAAAASRQVAAQKRANPIPPGWQSLSDSVSEPIPAGTEFIINQCKDRMTQVWVTVSRDVVASIQDSKSNWPNVHPGSMTGSAAIAKEAYRLAKKLCDKKIADLEIIIFPEHIPSPSDDMLDVMAANIVVQLWPGTESGIYTIRSNMTPEAHKRRQEHKRQNQAALEAKRQQEAQEAREKAAKVEMAAREKARMVRFEQFVKKHNLLDKKPKGIYANPFAFEGERVLVIVGLEQMQSASTGLFYLPDEGILFVNDVPKGAFVQKGQRIWMAAKVLGAVRFDGVIDGLLQIHGMVPNLKFLGSLVCRDSKCYQLEER